MLGLSLAQRQRRRCRCAGGGVHLQRPGGVVRCRWDELAGRNARYVFSVWGGIALISGIAALVGASTLQHASPGTVALITAVAAGAILAMLADTMIPEAFEEAHALTGLITAAGFLTAFTIGRLG